MRAATASLRASPLIVPERAATGGTLTAGDINAHMTSTTRPPFIVSTTDVPEDPFDDILTWGPIHLVVSRLLAAGRLP